jgi:hypothetical protein
MVRLVGGVGWSQRTARVIRAWQWCLYDSQSLGRIPYIKGLNSEASSLTLYGNIWLTFQTFKVAEPTNPHKE